MSFRTMAIICSIFTFLLGIGYLFAGSLLLARWQVEPIESLLLLGKRMGALYLGLSFIFFFSRSTSSSEVRTVLCTGAAITSSLLALLGIYELSAGHVGSGIVVSIALELFLALGFVWVLIREHRFVTGGRAHAAPSNHG